MTARRLLDNYGRNEKKTDKVEKYFANDEHWNLSWTFYSWLRSLDSVNSFKLKILGPSAPDSWNFLKDSLEIWQQFDKFWIKLDTHPDYLVSNGFQYKFIIFF
jgi:hypothetical protein